MLSPLRRLASASVALRSGAAAFRLGGGAGGTLARYLAVVAAAALVTGASLGIAVEQTAQHVAQRSAEHPVRARQLWRVPLPPTLTAADLHTVRLGPVVVAGGDAPATAGPARSPEPAAPAAVTVRVGAGSIGRARRVVASASSARPVDLPGGDHGWVEVVRHHGASSGVASRYLVRAEN
ncbi:hypothetical protein [Devosia sp.]|uniref:hypothetical protein n=1 Tax=Devosia sp. TaxID=1871048 RepID=UPI002F15AFA9